MRGVLPALSAALFLAGCVSTPVPLPADCRGTLPVVVALGARPDAALLAAATAPPGQGRLCGGRTFVVLEPLTVYRLADSTRPSSEFGAWWSLERPVETREQYRRKYAICEGWSALDRLVTCSVQPGTPLVLGPGQSVAACPPPQQAGLPQTEAIQVFLPGDEKRFLACSSTSWP
ncbi:hypothetical protein LZ009_22640 [Ramlibacter sp. XY19]|uniref:hypothetical protein n=1 Tax=Ramlibacter paludis TaxID=2908000 RepID=UPI0023DACDCF|nr:hypothetical protein [Ramlibacter paludis]MCG2595586.1 hypothetical protein [Ramlibacter paludis]